MDAGTALPSDGMASLTVELSDPNVFGITRKSYSFPYPTSPSQGTPQVEDASGVDGSTGGGADESPKAPPEIDFGPFPNESGFRLAEWYWKSTNKSFRDFQALMKIVKSPSFDLDGVARINWRTTFNGLGHTSDDEGGAAATDGWRCTPVSIGVPFHSTLKNSGIETYHAGKFYHRSLVSVIKERLMDPTETTHFRYHPYEEHWQRNDKSRVVELFGEMYASRAFRHAHEALQKLPSTKENQGLERVLVALMLWSDGTHLTSFGNATLWPCYAFFGNESKNDRRLASGARLGRQIAYFIKVSPPLLRKSKPVLRPV